MFWKVFIACSFVNAIAWMSAQSSFKTQTFYKELAKPDWAPPAYLFGIVWPILYTLMGYAAYRIYEKLKDNPFQAKKALAIFLIQYGLNVIWSPIFFGNNNMILGGFVIAFLLPFILWNSIEFYLIDKTAGVLLTPYLAWVSFATALTYYVIQMNMVRCL